MKNPCPRIWVGLLLGAANNLAFAQAQTGQQPPSGNIVPVTVDNFIRAETDTYFAGTVRQDGFGKFNHSRDPVGVDQQTIVRSNRDVLGSLSVFDLDAGPVTITLPDAGKRFRSLLAIDENHYNPATAFDAGDYVFTKEKVGTRYIMIVLRTLVDPSDPKDLEAARALQDATKVVQPGGPGRFEVPDWDRASQKKIRDALLVLGSTIPDYKGAFGTKDQVDPVRHLIATATAWGGNPESVAVYLNFTPPKNDGTTVYRLNVKDVPVDAFWSVSLYNAEGYFAKNQYGVYNINNVTAKKGPDDSVAIQFGGCDGQIPNCLPIVKDWNYIVRLYRPRGEILEGRWKLPEAHPMQ